MYEVRQQATAGFRVALVAVAVAHVVARYGDELLGLLFAGLSLGIGAGVVQFTQWVLFVAALAVLAPTLYPPPLRDFVAEVPVRLLVGSTGTVIAMLLADVDGLADAALLVGVAAGFFVALGASFRVYGVAVFDEESPLVRGMDWFAREDGVAKVELEQATAYAGWRRWVALGLFALATQVVVFVPVFVAGFLILVLVSTFPLSDLLVVAYVLGVGLASRVEWVGPPPTVLKVDDYLLTFARQATKGIHGIFVAFLFSVGLFASVTTPILVLRPATGLLFATLRPPIRPLLAWNVVGLYALYVAAALYGLWFWLRMAPRVVAFLERWNDEPRGTALESRPRTLLLPSLLAAVVASAGLGHGFLGANRHVFAVGWPLALLVVGWAVHRARQRHPTDARREDLAVVAATLLAYLTLVGSLAVGQGNPDALLAPEFWLFCGIVVYVAGIGRASRYGHRHNRRYGSDTDDERRLALPVYLGLGGLLALLTTGYLDGTLRTMVAGSGLALLAFAAALGYVEYHHL